MVSWSLELYLQSLRDSFLLFHLLDRLLKLGFFNLKLSLVHGVELVCAIDLFLHLSFQGGSCLSQLFDTV